MLLKLVRKGLFELISANFMMQFVGFGLLILLPRFVSEAEIGRIKVLQTYTDLLIILAGLGMNTAILKLCADVRPSEEKKSLLRLAATWTTVSAVVILAALFVAIESGLITGDPEVLRWLPLYALIVPFAAVSVLAMAYLQAQKRIREMARAQILVRIQSVVLILLATWYLGIQGFVYASVLAFGIGLWPYARLIGADLLHATKIKASATFKSISAYSLAGNFMNTLGKYADIYVLGLFALDPVELGYYSLATIFVIPASVVTSSIQTIATPFLAEKSGDRPWFGSTLRQTQLQTVLVAICAALAARLGATVVITYLYRPGFEAALPYLDILLVYYVLRSSYAVLASGHIALGLTKYNFIASSIMAIIALTLTYSALEPLGYTGVAWAKVTTAGLMVFVYAFLSRRAIRVAPIE